MCHIIEQNQTNPFLYMTVIIEKRDMDIDSVNVELTSDYEYLKTAYFPGFFKFSVPFGGIKVTQTTIMETMIKPLNCKSSDSYVSDMQCYANLFFSQDLSPCPVKCLPIQMKGSQYANKSTTIEYCTKLEDEICNGGPFISTKLNQGYLKCLKPCKETSYKDSETKLAEPVYLKEGKNMAYIDVIMNNVRRIEKEVLVYDTIDVIGAVGGSLGLFLGFSFFDVFSKCLDNLIMPLMIYLSSKIYCNEKQPTLVRSKPVLVQKPSNLLVTHGQ